jgi:hypothetical protein
MRIRLTRAVFVLPACLALFVAVGCGERARGGTTDVAVTEIDLGRDLKADTTVSNETDSFHGPDVVYTVVTTKGSGPAKLAARWMFEDNQLIAEDALDISPNGPARTEFHLSKPTGLASGHYTVEIFLNGKPVEKKTFVVQ